MGATGPVALLVAAGSGSRLGASVPKAFVELAGRPMLEWSLDALRAAGISEIVVALPDGVDLHARPAADFVRTAMRFDAQIAVTVNGRDADAKSLLAVLALGAKAGTTLRLSADGDDSGAAVDALAGCVVELTE